MSSAVSVQASPPLRAAPRLAVLRMLVAAAAAAADVPPTVEEEEYLLKLVLSGKEWV